MDLLIIAGFLGSGKTTLLLPVVRHLVNQGKKVVVIENEVGKVGVDDQYLKAQGLAVRELFSGCVCCQLRADLLTTLYDLEKTVNPDVVVIEPSGVASPGQVLDGLVGYGGNLDRRCVLALIDPVRFLILRDWSLPIITDSIAVADLVIITKIDRVTNPQRQAIEEKIYELRPDATILGVCAPEETGLDALFDRLVFHHASSQVSEPSAQMPDGPTPTIQARKMDLKFSPPVPSDRIADNIADAMARLADDLSSDGQPFLGHLKAVLKTPQGGFCLFSLTDRNQPPTRKGPLPDQIDQASLTVNAILYGHDAIALYEKLETHFAELKKYMKG